MTNIVAEGNLIGSYRKSLLESGLKGDPEERQSDLPYLQTRDSEQVSDAKSAPSFFNQKRKSFGSEEVYSVEYRLSGVLKTTPSLMGSTVKNGTPKETGHLLWQKVQKGSSDDYSGSRLEAAHHIESQSRNIVRFSDESGLVAHLDKNGFTMASTSLQPDDGRFSSMLVNPEGQVSGHDISTRSVKSGARSNGLQKFSHKNLNEMKINSATLHGKGDYFLDHGLQSKSRVRPIANGHGQEIKFLGNSKAVWSKDEQGNSGADDLTGSFKQQKHLRNSTSTSSFRNEYFGISHPAPEVCEPHRPRSAPSTANGSVNGFRELRSPVQKIGQGQVSPRKKPSIPELFTSSDLSEMPSMNRFVAQQASLDEFGSRTTGKWKKHAYYVDKNFHKEKSGEKEYMSHHIAQKWVPVDHKSGGSPVGSPKLNKAQGDGAKHVSVFEFKEPMITEYSSHTKRGNIRGPENGQSTSESTKEMLWRSREVLVTNQDPFDKNEFVELQAEGLSPPSVHVRNVMKIPLERANSATNDAQLLESRDFPGKLSSPDDDFSNVARAILDAVHTSLEGRKIAERLSAAVGCPIAEFEKVLEAVAPTITLTSDNSVPKNAQRSCKICSHKENTFQEHVLSDFMEISNKDLISRKQVDDIPLSVIWDWYEESGNYGVEVKSLNFKDGDKCDRAHVLSAFFVPYLSGLQLFECTGSCCQRTKRSSEANAWNNLEEHSDYLLWKNSNERHNKNIFDTLLPKPSIVDKEGNPSSSSVSQDAEKLTCRSCCRYDEHSAHSNVNLLFEFYDAEQPQHRRTLLQKVHQLIKGDIEIQSQRRGNAALLGSLKLGDLHPASWFSVAWYPIYRIPEGLARDVFLTYHSFGHVVLENGSSCKWSTSTPCSISMPVVGLQYYNCQVDQWLTLSTKFQKIMVLEKEGLFEVPAKVLQDRLNALKTAAAVMSGHPIGARAKNIPLVSKHCDYQFFVSRGR